MKRILLLVTVALMLAAAMALSGVAQAAPTIGTKADAKCLAEAAKTVDQPGFNPSNYTFHGGTAGDDIRTFTATDGPDVFCGFGGFDWIDTLDEGDIFLGGAGTDIVGDNFGTYYGGAGGDFVLGSNERGATFYGGEGDDDVGVNTGTFYGGAGNDEVSTNISSGTFYGQEGDDRVQSNLDAFFNGGPGDDTVAFGDPPVDGSP